MPGCSAASVLIVNAEVDSMGGVAEGGIGIDNKTSPRKAVIEKVQAALRQECSVRDERKRELEFLEKGGNPLDFKFGFVSSVSVRSTSIPDPHPDRFVTSEAKGSFAFTASPHGDSVESSGRPGTTPSEPNSADNLMLFDAEHELTEGGRSMSHKSIFGQSDQSLRMDGGRKTLEHGDSAAFGVPRNAYKRRYRSRPNRDGARSSSTDVNPARGCHVSSLPSRHGTRDVKGRPDAENQNKPTSPTIDILPKTIVANGQDNIELAGSKSFQSTKDKTQGVKIDTGPDAIGSGNPPGEQFNRPLVTEQLNRLSVSVTADTPKQMNSNGPEAPQMDKMNSAVNKCQPGVKAIKVENEHSSCQMKGFSRKVEDEVMTDGPNSRPFRGTKVLDSESSGTQTSLSIDGNNNSEMCARVRNIDSNGNIKYQSLQDDTAVIESDNFSTEKKDTEAIDSSTLVGKESASGCQSQRDKDVPLQPDFCLDQTEPALEKKVNNQMISGGMLANGPTQLESGWKSTDPSVHKHELKNETSSNARHKDPVDVSNSDLPEVGILTRVSTVPAEALTSSVPDLTSSVPDLTSSMHGRKLESKIDEDSILKEAQIIEAKRKRIAELSLVTSAVEMSRKSHWDFVLEEVAWMANDFAQERIWKVAAASQISYQVAVTCLLRKKEKNSGMDAKRVAHTLAKAVMDFWHSIESQVQETSKELEQQHQNNALPVRAYAARFLKCNKPNVSHNQTAVPLTPDRMSDSGISDLTWDDSLTEENLFYTIPPGAMETYRKAIESHMAQLEKTGSIVHDEVGTSVCNAAADLEYQDNSYDEDEGETNTYNMPVAFEGSISSGYGQKKRKHLTHAYGARSYGMGTDLFPMQFAENKVVTPQSALLAKRPGSNLDVSIPTKRTRTASRRVISPFGAGASGCIQAPNKTDASSCDTSSLQDDQSSLRGGLSVPNNLEVESAREFEKKLPFDTAEVSMRPKKKKKAKHPSAAYEERWQVDSTFRNEQFQRDHLQKRLEGHQLESNGNSGLSGQPIAKKPKLMRQQDDSFDYIPPNGGPVPSPVGSQISNMSNPNKFIKMLGGRDRGRKAKAHKMPAGQPGSGIQWSPFEDQALIVLAHDLGPNWELVSDAFNSTVQFKCIFRKAKECKERHIILTDITSGDGADSAEDSGSSQPYRSTLPGIPKGSARQLFQRLQGPMEEETLKSHFEKIIMIGKKQHYCKTQDPKQFQQPHSSHTIALSQVCPNNLNGGPILTPLDLYDASISGPDVPPPVYQGAHSSGLAISNQGPVPQTLPLSSASSPLPGSANMMIGNSFSSSPGSLNSSARYVVPRSGSLPADEHQRMHVHNQMVPGRNIPQPNITAPGALPGTDRGVRMLPSGNGMGIVPGVDRGMPMARPGFQGLVNSGSVGPPGMSSPNMHAAVGAAQGSSMVRPPMMRPGPSQDSQRQTLVPDHQMATNSQGMSHFGPLHRQPSHPMSPQQPHFQGSANHASNPQQQAYAMRLAKERQLHQRFLQHQQYATSNPLMPHVQSQSQLPISSPVNSSQVQPQTSSPVSVPPVTSPPVNTVPLHQQKHPTAAQGVARKRQQNQFSQANRQHPQQRQAQQPAKVVKGVGRGNQLMHHNVPNGTNPGNQSSEKAEAPSNSIQSKGPYAGPPQNSVQSTRPFMTSQSNQTLPQQKIYSGQASSSSKQLQQTSVCDNSSQGHQSSPSFTGSNNQASCNQKLVNQNQSPPQRLVQPNRHINLGPSNKLQGKDSDADQHPASSSAEMDTSKLPQASDNASNAAQVVPQRSAHKWHASEHSDTNALNSQKKLSSLVSTTSTSSDSVPHSGQGPGSRPSTSLPLTQGEASAQWKQPQQSQVP